MEYYSIPLKVKDILKGKKVDNEMEIKQSIHQNIHLMLKAFTLSYRFDTSFGSVLHRYHASTPPQKVKDSTWQGKIEEAIQANLKDMLKKYETRIKVKNVTVNIRQPKKSIRKGAVKVMVEVEGKFNTGQGGAFHYPDSELSENNENVFPLMIPIGNINKK